MLHHLFLHVELLEYRGKTSLFGGTEYVPLTVSVGLE